MKEQLIKGKWYKAEEDRYYKFNGKIENCGYYNRIGWSNKILNTQYEENINRYFANTDFEKTILKNGPINISEIAHLLPKNHPDLNQIIEIW